MESLAALGVASSVTQFVDFTWKLITETRAIRKSATGMSEDVLLLDTILHDVDHMSGRLQDEARNASRPRDADSCSRSLERLASESVKLAAELRDDIQTLKVDKKNSAWSSFQAALKQMSKRGRLESLTGKLAKLQSQIAQHVLMELRLETTRKRLDRRTRGLLEFQSEIFGADTPPLVGFLHRTVRDFLHESKEARAALQGPLSPDSGTALMLCRAILAHNKFTGIDTIWGDDVLIRSQYLDVLFYFAERCTRNDQDRRRLLYDVIFAIEQFAQLCCPRTPVVDVFIGLACRHEMAWYVEQRLSVAKLSLESKNSQRRKTLQRPLQLAFAGEVRSSKARLDCVRALLEAGADPNGSTSEGLPAWILFVKRFLATDSQSESVKDFARPACALLLAHGASAFKVITGTRGAEVAREFTAREVVELYMGREETKRLFRDARRKRMLMNPWLRWALPTS